MKKTTATNDRTRGVAGAAWFDPPIPVEHNCVVVAYDSHFELVLLETPSGLRNTHWLAALSKPHRTEILRRHAAAL